MLLGLLLIPVVEIGALVAVGEQIGYGWAVLATLAASALGVLVIRAEGQRSVRRFRQTVESGEVPGREASNGALRMVAGLALAVPGLVTDALGLLLLLPPVRSVIRAMLLRSFIRRVSPEVANQVFGPRRVRARRGRARADQAQRSAPAGDTESKDTPEVLEGEIIDPPEPR